MEGREEIRWRRPSSDSSSHRGRTSRANAEARGAGGEWVESGGGAGWMVVGVSVIDATADWGPRHAYMGKETKARLGGLACGGQSKIEGDGWGSERIAGDDIRIQLIK